MSAGAGWFFVGLAGPMVLALAARFVLGRSLREFLTEVCRGDRRGAFWSDVFTLGMLTSAPFAASLHDGLLLMSEPSRVEVASSVALQWFLGVSGIAASLAIQAFSLYFFLERVRCDDPPPARPLGGS
ncbi:MAG: hypothetical protein JNJ88_08610 [Planctomycetes bacterium]|nr:hypothetical protein [Planctomycetota bacterium]